MEMFKNFESIPDYYIAVIDKDEIERQSGESVHMDIQIPIAHEEDMINTVAGIGHPTRKQVARFLNIDVKTLRRRILVFAYTYDFDVWVIICFLRILFLRCVLLKPDFHAPPGEYWLFEANHPMERAKSRIDDAIRAVQRQLVGTVAFDFNSNKYIYQGRTNTQFERRFNTMWFVMMHRERVRKHKTLNFMLGTNNMLHEDILRILFPRSKELF